MRKKRILPTAVTVLTLLLCAALCLSALSLYREGTARRAETSASEPVFTAEGAGRQLLRVAPLAALWLAAAAAAAVTGHTASASPAAQDPDTALRLLEARVSELPEAARKERGLRRRNGLLCAAALVLCAGWALLWLLDRSHFESWDLEAVMGAMLLHTVPPAVLAFAAMYLRARADDASRNREIVLLREQVRRQPPESARPVPVSAVSETRGRRVLRAALYAAAVLLVVLGICNGGLRDVFVKAVNICTECIGLG